MMLPKPSNPNLLSQLKKAFVISFKYKQQGQEQEYLSFDFDFVRYRIKATQDKIQFSFYCDDFQNIWKGISDYFTKTHYPEFSFKVPGVDGYAITCNITNQQLSKINAKKDDLINTVCQRFSLFKRNVLASPFQVIMTAVKTNTIVNNISYSLRPNERTWIALSKNQFTVYFGISFTQKSEQQIARILLTQFTEAKKHVNNSPAVLVTQSELPALLIQAFPSQKSNKYEFTNGIMSMTFFNQTIQDISNQAYLLGNLRHYLQYHIHASKCYLHSRIINRIQVFYRSLNLTKFEKTTIEFVKQ